MTLDELEHEIVRVLRETPAARWPAAAPRDPHLAARWLLRLLEPQQREEQPQQRTLRDGSAITVWPYWTRALCQARRFITLPAPVQQAIVAGVAQGVWWRGEAVEDFQRVVAQALRDERNAFIHQRGRH
ncbi:MAG: hypothetical protein ACRCV5_10370 [Afipia sp.]